MLPPGQDAARYTYPRIIEAFKISIYSNKYLHSFRVYGRCDSELHLRGNILPHARVLTPVTVAVLSGLCKWHCSIFIFCT